MRTQSGVPSNTVPSSTPPAHRPSLAARIFALPSTWAGLWSIALAVGFFVCFGLFLLVAATGQTGGDTFGSNLWLAVPIMAAGASAIGGAVTAIVAIIKQGERSFLVIGPLLLGLLVAIFLVLEVSIPH
jgi:hypothetical protein